MTLEEAIDEAFEIIDEMQIHAEMSGEHELAEHLADILEALQGKS